MPYGTHNSDSDDDAMEMASPACYMGIVDWDYGFDNFFSNDISERRRSCQQAPKQKQHCSLQAQSSVSATAESAGPEETATSQATPAASSSSSCCNSTNNSSSNDNAPETTSAEKNNSSSTSEPEKQHEEKEEKEQEQQQETNSRPASTTPVDDEEQEQHNTGSTEGFSDFCGGEQVDGDEWSPDNNNKDDDDFGDFEDFEEFNCHEEEQQQQQEHGDLLNAWSTVLRQVYLDDKTTTGDKDKDEWVSSHGPKSIRYYVLEEAHESVHSKITWTSVTYTMDQDSGVPRVRWPHSKIENMYLDALHCERLEPSTAPLVPSMLSIGDEDDTSLSGDDDDDDSDIQPAPSHAPTPSYEKQQAPAKPPTTPGSSIKSPIFGFSFSKLLPRLSTTSLPRSDSSAPTSATPSTPQRYSLESIPRTSDGTGTTSPAGKDHHRSRTSSPIPLPIAASPPPVILPQSNSTDEKLNHSVQSHYQNQCYVGHTEKAIPEKRYSMPVTSTSSVSPWSTVTTTMGTTIGMTAEQQPKEQQQQRRRPMTMINTTLANKSFSILDLDDDDMTTVVSTPPASSRSFSFTPLIPTPTRATTSIPPLTPKKAKVDEGKDLHNNISIIGNNDYFHSPPAVCTTIQDDQEFGEFAGGIDIDDFGDFEQAKQEEQQEEWGDWNGGSTTVITSH